jgi:transcription antitermination factor NusG
VSEDGGAVSLSIPGIVHEKILSSIGGVATPEHLWFAVQTRPRHEKKVNSSFHEKGIDSFLPLHREKRRWSDRSRWVELPMFSQYLFVRIPVSAEVRTRVLQTSGVVQFVGTDGRGTPIPDEQINALYTIVFRKIPTKPHEFLRVGERVRICGGVLEGLEGILSAIRNDKTLVVSVDLIQKSVAVQIDGFEVEPA